MLPATMKVTPEPHTNVERIPRGTYQEYSGGLLLAATSIITGTSKDTHQDMVTARRLKNSAAIKYIEKQVSN